VAVGGGAFDAEKETPMTDLQAVIDTPGYGTGKDARDRLAAGAEISQLLPDPASSIVADIVNAYRLGILKVQP